jgi:hypothetical protein
MRASLQGSPRRRARRAPGRPTPTSTCALAHAQRSLVCEAGVAHARAAARVHMPLEAITRALRVPPRTSRSRLLSRCAAARQERRSRQPPPAQRCIAVAARYAAQRRIGDATCCNACVATYRCQVDFEARRVCNRVRQVLNNVVDARRALPRAGAEPIARLHAGAPCCTLPVVTRLEARACVRCG